MPYYVLKLQHSRIAWGEQYPGSYKAWPGQAAFGLPAAAQLVGRLCVSMQDPPSLAAAQAQDISIQHLSSKLGSVLEQAGPRLGSRVYSTP